MNSSLGDMNFYSVIKINNSAFYVDEMAGFVDLSDSVSGPTRQHCFAQFLFYFEHQPELYQNFSRANVALFDAKSLSLLPVEQIYSIPNGLARTG